MSTMSYDNLKAAGFPVQTDRQTLKQGENLTKGTLLGKIASSGLLVACKSSASDGSQNPYRILMEDTDATLADTPCSCYRSGAFNEDAIVLAETGDLIDDFKDAMDSIGLYVKPFVPDTEGGSSVT